MFGVRFHNILRNAKGRRLPVVTFGMADACYLQARLWQ